MTIIEQFLSVVDRYCSASGLAEATVSSRTFNDGKRIKAVRSGADIGARRLLSAMQWFSDNWPEGAAWPEEVERPLRQSSSAAATSSSHLPCGPPQPLVSRGP